jgi:hypothetical protein
MAGGALLIAHAILACGSRTGLFVLNEADARPPDPPDSASAPDTTIDVAVDSGVDASDTSPDALPPIDVHPADVVVVGCLDAGATEIYLVTAQNEMLSFYPPTTTLTDIGPLDCPSTASPNSMGVDRVGTAYVNFADGTLFQVSTASAACAATPFAPGQDGFEVFGMGYVGDPADGGDTLHVASDFAGASDLATIDTSSFVLSPIGPFGPGIVQSPELTGTGDGRLFAFYVDPNDPTQTSSLISQIDPLTAQEIASSPLPGLLPGMDYAFAFWGGDFYIFTSTDGNSSQVTRFSPSDGSMTVVLQTPFGQAIVGAGVSTCAPMQ